MLTALAALPNVHVWPNVTLDRYTRFGLGGPVEAVVDAREAEAFLAALAAVRGSGRPYAVIGKGTNLIAADEGFDGIVLRFTANRILAAGTRVTVEAGAELQDLVDFTIVRGLRGLETMTGIPGWVGAAVYGNAGAYGHSIEERARTVRFFDGERIRIFENEECEFAYRESIFKRHKDWIILSAELMLDAADAVALRRTADEILKIRNAKYPPTMKCAGSIFKNLLVRELPVEVTQQIPPAVIREGKVPSAWFLEQVGAKGIRQGDIQVATYHANLIYNDGAGASRDLHAVVDVLKGRVRQRFGLELEEEVQYLPPR